MFHCKREEALEVLKELHKNQICHYGGSIPCDCKYSGKDIQRFGPATGEANGCPEMRNALFILEHMTDEEYENIINRVYEKSIDDNKFHTATYDPYSESGFKIVDDPKNNKQMIENTIHGYCDVLIKIDNEEQYNDVCNTVITKMDSYSQTISYVRVKRNKDYTYSRVWCIYGRFWLVF